LLGVLGWHRAGCRPTSHHTTQNAKDARAPGSQHNRVLGGLACLAACFQSRPEYMGTYAHIYIYTFFLLKNISNKMTIRQAPHANTLIRHAYNPAKHGFFPGRLLPSFSPKTPTNHP
jgi:hypothetical protein